ncbi:Uncharacterised protein [[Clostridium] sordellii]|uniref:hypothetical protein n=1 Tax=Paraclostridium sordellii TaxID=1505 RepID=UPI0005E64C7A|nr:hypothetical protein [Paeniclostridium sordellii]CEQ01207.1 Uncharacterised protein [[Clostridium] sordellii] [Paeniclostridium sordellii]
MFGKKAIAGILSGIIIFGSGMFIGKINTVDNDTYENLKSKHEKTVKEVNTTKKDLNKANKELSKLNKTVDKEYSQEDNQTVDKEVKRASNNEKGYVHENTTTKSSDAISNQGHKSIENPPVVEQERKVLIPAVPEKPSDIVPSEESPTDVVPTIDGM